MDDKGNVYVADTLNLAIRKIGDSGSFIQCSRNYVVFMLRNLVGLKM